MSISRRSVLGAGFAALAGSAVGLPEIIGTGQRPTARVRRPKNIIFMVVDGMAIQTMTMADHFQQVVHGRRSYWSMLMDEPEVRLAYQDTRSLNSLVTDSAAASSSWGSGRHIWNGQLNMFPDGTELRPLMQIFKEGGLKTGLVTTTTITHATPAGFSISCPQRDLEGLIAEKYLAAGLDVMMGGGDRHFSGSKRKDKKDLYAEFTKSGYKVVKNRNEMQTVKSGKVLGIFSDSHLPYSVDRDQSYSLRQEVPTLAEMVSTAIPLLNTGRNGFVLQVEGGKVDHGAHANDLAAMIYDQIAFEEAIKVVVDFARKDGDTLVVITADHACGGPSLNGAGAEYIESTAGLKTLAGMKSSYGPIFEDFGKSPSAGRVREVIESRLGLALSLQEAEAVSAAAKNESPLKLSGFQSSMNGTLAAMLSNHTKVAFTSGNHTNDHVIVTALGPSSERIRGLVPNISFFDFLLELKGLKHQNATMTFEEAQRHYDKMKASIDPEWFEMYAAHDECVEDHRHFNIK